MLHAISLFSPPEPPLFFLIFTEILPLFFFVRLIAPLHEGSLCSHLRQFSSRSSSSSPVSFFLLSAEELHLTESIFPSSFHLTNPTYAPPAFLILFFNNSFRIITIIHPLPTVLHFLLFVPFFILYYLSLLSVLRPLSFSFLFFIFTFFIIFHFFCSCSK